MKNAQKYKERYVTTANNVKRIGHTPNQKWKQINQIILTTTIKYTPQRSHMQNKDHPPKHDMTIPSLQD
jgi:hypothetical protein